ncbi:hypothetical protein E2C01_036197 [Portunus trituberculatus]|uniref:Uncharacterized protein n=1 Tax=Portunus trituberculatus TaxID=210409 RepID=A0A5B7FDK2_PORTR|nr:hypothetical protein [Portunus trituberculatus]
MPLGEWEAKLGGQGPQERAEGKARDRGERGSTLSLFPAPDIAPPRPACQMHRCAKETWQLRANYGQRLGRETPSGPRCQRLECRVVYKR